MLLMCNVLVLLNLRSQRARSASSASQSASKHAQDTMCVTFAATARLIIGRRASRCCVLKRGSWMWQCASNSASEATRSDASVVGAAFAIIRRCTSNSEPILAITFLINLISKEVNKLHRLIEYVACRICSLFFSEARVSPISSVSSDEASVLPTIVPPPPIQTHCHLSFPTSHSL